jgi:hypothetical protein
MAAEAVSDAIVLARGRAQDNGLIVITGSLYVVAEARGQLGLG